MRKGILLAVLASFAIAVQSAPAQPHSPAPTSQQQLAPASPGTSGQVVSPSTASQIAAAPSTDREPPADGGLLKKVTEFVNFLGDLFAIAASGIAIYLFFFKRNEIKSAFDALTAFAQQASMFELTQKLELINSLSARDDEGKDEIIAIFHDICGHLEGNPKLKHSCAAIVVKIRRVTNSKSFGEPHKRSLVSELRESLRHISAGTFASAIGEDGK